MRPFLFLALAAPAFAAPAGPARVPVFERTLVFNLPADMIRANDRNNGTNILIEYVPKGQTLANWTRLVTIQAYRGLGRSPMKSADIARQAFYPASCTTGPIYRDGGERILASGLKRSIIANGCASLPEGAYPKALRGAGEQNYIMMFRDADSIYTLNYAVRGAAFAGKAPPLSVEGGEAILRDIFGEVTLNPSP
ncbi:MAG TPA: hypothetical protein PKK17_07050 [Sphingorhabdus lacus]|jgi:hypothetical protein|nr:hypothetical protein [Sphingorhabdus lacus]HPV68321.1 hypothetical protein [Sphingorhabdus lacus]